MRISVRPRRRGFAPAAMADIAFLLLIFFITTTSIDEDRNLELPDFAFSRETGFPDTARLLLQADGSLSLDGQLVAAATDQLAGLESGLLSRYHPEETVILVEADRFLPYKSVDAVLSVLGRNGFERIVLVAQPGSAENTGASEP